MIRGLDSLLAESLGRGERVARATVVTAHDGQVSARNLPDGAGVEFLIRLPGP